MYGNKLTEEQISELLEEEKNLWGRINVYGFFKLIESKPPLEKGIEVLEEKGISGVEAYCYLKKRLSSVRTLGENLMKLSLEKILDALKK